MITSRRDYLLRIIDEVGRLVARIVFKRETNADQEALELVVQGFERLFNLERYQLFQFTPEQQFVMLTLDEPPENARDKALLYAALSLEAGQVYTKMGNAALARATFTNALRFALKANSFETAVALPVFAPSIADLASRVSRATLDAETLALLTDYESRPPAA